LILQTVRQMGGKRNPAPVFCSVRAAGRYNFGAGRERLADE